MNDKISRQMVLIKFSTKVLCVRYYKNTHTVCGSFGQLLSNDCKVNNIFSVFTFLVGTIKALFLYLLLFVVGALGQ